MKTPSTRIILVFLALSLASLNGAAAEHLRILLTNDDGYDSKGIQALHQALKEAGHNVYLIAPAEQQSGASASVTTSGVKVTEHGNQVWAVHGRPADAVRVGLGNIMLNNPPHLVVSGANFGQNTGQDVNVSGTVGAAITALRLGVPAIAVSVEIKFEEAERGFPSTAGAFTGAARALVRLIRNLDLDDLDAVLNVNYPARLPLDIKGVRWSELSSHSIFGLQYNRQADGTYRPQFQLPHRNARARDAESLIDGYITLTFLDGDLSVRVKRTQKYLDRGLIDRNYAPTQPARAKPARVAAPAPRPEPSVGRPVKPVKAPEPQQPARPTQVIERTPKDNTNQPMPARALENEPEPTGRSAEFAPSEPGNPTRLIERKPAAAPIQLPASAPVEVLQAEPVGASGEPSGEPSSELTQSPAETESAESQPAPVTGKSAKPKPDSWLRRMFNPDSWRR